MIKRISIFYFLFFFCLSGIAQNKILDSTTVASWPSLINADISPRGDYFYYKYSRRDERNKETVVLASTNGNWRREYTGVSFCCFSSNNKDLIIRRTDTVIFVGLGTNEERIISTNVSKFDVERHNDGEDWKWIIYKTSDQPENLFLINTETGGKQMFTSVLDYSFSGKTHNILLTRKGSNNSYLLELIRLGMGDPIKIWEGEKGEGITKSIFDNNGKQLIFLSRHSIDTSSYSIWYYREGFKSAQKRTIKLDGFNKERMNITSIRFSVNANDRWIVLDLAQVKEDKVKKVDGSLSKVNIWDYRDIEIQPQQQVGLDGKNTRTITKSIGVYITNEDENWVGTEIPADGETIAELGDYLVLCDNKKVTDFWWHFASQPSYYLLSIKDNSKRLLEKNYGFRTLSNFSISPDEKWLIYFDMRKAAYCSFEIQTGIQRNITKALNVRFDNKFSNSVYRSAAEAPIGWISETNSVLLYDNYDIWMLDPSGSKSAVSITGGIGGKESVRLRIVDEYHKKKFHIGDTLLLTGFSEKNKYNGFYKQIIGRSEVLISLHMGPYLYYPNVSSDYPYGGVKPIKALLANVWLVRRQSFDEAPNLFLTSDFKTYNALTDLQPQKKIRWVKAELISWRMFNGKTSQGILYKPSDFDPNRKYPVLFNYYERLSFHLYEFLEPDFVKENINIPWFVNHGYLVFLPDIQYEVAVKSDTTVGGWAYNAVVSAAQYLSTFPYVDSKHMAIQGHSYGGGETNYIVTHSSMFAAAAEAAGRTDPLSAYLTLTPGTTGEIFEYEKQSQSNYERGHEQIGATPWERPDLYLKGSAVLHADKITTPLLIMHNERDNNIQWRQGVELYMAMRRLGKTCWMLQYDQGTHTLRGNDAVDYTKRIEQFFDHYLKNAPAPVWMTQGIPARLKQIENGYSYDPAGNCGKDCKVCKMWNEKYKKNPQVTLKEIEEKRKSEHWGM